MAVPIFRLGLLGGGLMMFAIGAYVFVYKPGWVERIPWRNLSESPEFEANYKDKWGGKYGRFMLEAYQSKNKPFWERRFRDFETITGRTGKFALVTKAFGDDDESLNKVCDDAYRAEKQDVVAFATSGSNQFKEAEVWAFCSINMKKKITSLEELSSESYSGSETYGSKYKHDMIATSDKAKNEIYWEVQQDELKHEKNWKGGSSNMFKALFDYLTKGDESEDDMEFLGDAGEANTAQERSHEPTPKTLREVCQKAYGSEVSNEGAYPKEYVFKFCSLSGRDPDAKPKQVAPSDDSED